jgi:hypothetical protein
MDQIKPGRHTASPLERDFAGNDPSKLGTRLSSVTRDGHSSSPAVRSTSCTPQSLERVLEVADMLLAGSAIMIVSPKAARNLEAIGV